MDMSPEERIAAIRKLYEELPPLSSCKGLCSVGCVDVDMSELERLRIKQRQGVTMRKTLGLYHKSGPKKCKALKKNGACGVYEDRPLICRAWGAIEAAPCPFGCVPDNGTYLTDEQYKGLQLAVEQLGGHWHWSDEDRRKQLAFYATPAGRQALRQQMDAARAEVARMGERLPGVSDAGSSGSDVS